MSKEIGRIGQRRYGGVIYEEFLPELRGSRGVEIYREMSENDDVVGAILYAIEMLVRQTDWIVEPGGGTAKDREAAEFVQSCMDDMQSTWVDTVSEILSFLTYGWSLHEIVYKRRMGNTRDTRTRSKYSDGLIGWAKLPIRSQETLYQWEYDEADNLVGMTQMPPPDFGLLTIPMSKALLFRTKVRKDNPEGRSILRNAYRSWHFKRRIQEIEGIGIERDLAGLPVIYTPEDMDIWNSEDETISRIRAELENMVRGVRRDEREGLVLPGGFKMELLSTGGSRQFDTNAIIDRYDTNLAGSMTLMQSAVEGVQNSFGKRLSPYLKTAVEGITAEMPAVEEALNNIMDVVDGKATSLKRSIKSMTGSQEWKDADFFGKVDIAWDKIIAEPFMSWAGSEGKSMLSQGIGKLFSSASAILPGGEKAGLTSWLSAGLIGVGASKLISGGKNVASALTPIGSAIKNIASAASEADTVGGFFTSLTGMTSKAGMIGLGAAAIVAAIAGIAVAVDNYNSKVLNDNLEEHFGKIKLSAKEAEEIASGILNQKYLTNVELALNEVKNADSLREAAQKALESNDVLEFKSRVGITLTPEEREDYTSNIKTFVDSKIEELQSRTFAAHIHVQTYIGGTKEGDTLAKNIEDWARADNLELTNLSNDLQTAVEKALTDGIIDVDEEQAISALQEKMNNITARWKESEAQAKWDWINQEYGNLNAADLESGSFTDLLEAMRGQRQSAKESVQADVEQWYSELNSMESAGRITAAQNKQYKEMTGWYVKGQEGSELTKSLQLGANTLNSAYAEKIQSNRQSLAENAQYSLESAQNMLASGDTFSASNALMYGFNELGNGKTLGFTTDAILAGINGGV